MANGTKQKEQNNGLFKITSVHRDDIASRFGDKVAKSFTDEEMVYLAGKMADAYCECCFWIALEIIVENILEDRK